MKISFGVAANERSYFRRLCFAASATPRSDQRALPSMIPLAASAFVVICARVSFQIDRLDHGVLTIVDSDSWLVISTSHDTIRPQDHHE